MTDFLARVALAVILAFCSAFVYSHCWNLVMPGLYALPTITMLQAYVAAFTVGVMTLQGTKIATIKDTVIAAYGKYVAVLIVAYVVRYCFM
jgi:hypothetical protein